MKIKILKILGIIILSIFLLNSCKRNEYTAPNLKGPAVKDLYALINLGKTVLTVGSNTTVTVKVVSNFGPVKNAKVSFILTSYDGESYSKWGEIFPNKGNTDENGIFKTTLYAPISISGRHAIKVVGYISGDPYLFNNRILTVQAVVIFTE